VIDRLDGRSRPGNVDRGQLPDRRKDG